MKTEKMEQKETTLETKTHAGIYEALANFQYDCPTIPKLKQGYGYSYAELSKTVELIKPHLKKNQIGYTQFLEEENKLTTVIFHYPTKEELRSTVTMPVGFILNKLNLYQTDGARNTYYKRYSLLSILGVMTEEEDLDARGTMKKAKENETETQEKPKAKLTNAQFINLIGAIKTGQTTVEACLEFYDLNEQQKMTLTNGEI
jgi:hypothetical protein